MLSSPVKRLALSQAKADVSYVVVNVAPEVLQPTAQVVESGLTVVSANKAVLGAFAVAGEQKLAFTTLPWQRAGLVKPELALLFREHHARTRDLKNVSQLVLGIHVVVADVEISVVLQRHSLAAELVIDTHLRAFPIHIETAFSKWLTKTLPMSRWYQ